MLVGVFILPTSKLQIKIYGLLGGPRKSAFCRISRHWEKAKTILTDFDTEGIEEANVLSKIASRGGCWFLLEIGTFAKQ